MNTSLQLLKYKLHHRTLNTACSKIYSKSLDDMPLNLISPQNDSTTPQPVNFYVGLKNTSSYL